MSLAQQWPGPLATLLLADLGADVILVERPGSGDPSRRYAGHFSALNRNKRSVALDLKSTQGHEGFLRLLDSADALIEGFRPGVMDRLGLGPDALRRRSPELVYVSISAFGQTGPRAHVAGHDLSIQGYVGLIDVAAGGEAEAALPILPLADIASGTFAALGVVVMLLSRVRSGSGGYLDVAMLDSLMFWMAPLILPRLNGQRGAPLPPKDPAYGLFASADGRQFTLSIAGEDHLWMELCSLLDLADLSGLTEEQRVARRSAVEPQLRAALLGRSWSWLEPRLAERRITFGPVLRPENVPLDRQVASRGLFFEIARENGTVEQHMRQPLHFGGALAVAPRAAPSVGQHNDEIFGELDRQDR